MREVLIQEVGCRCLVDVNVAFGKEAHLVAAMLSLVL